MAQQYKLTYFDIYGRAETARLLFHMAGVPFEDVHYNYFTDWSEHKSETRWGVVPELQVGGEGKLAQSNAINFYLGKKFGYGGDSDWEDARILEHLLSWTDIGPRLAPYFKESDAAKKKGLIDTVVRPTFKEYFGRLQKELQENGTGHFVGKNLTVADINTFVGLTGWDSEGVIPGLIDEFPELRSFVERIGALPKVKEWLAIRPSMPFASIEKTKK